MMRCSGQPRGRIFVKGYRFMSFATSVSKNIDKNISKILSGKYNQKLLGHAEQSATDTFKVASKKVLRVSPQNSSEIENIGLDREI